MTKVRRRVAIIATATMTIALGGCGGDEEGPRGVLTEDDVANVLVAQDTNEDLGRAGCEALNTAALESRLFNEELDNDRRFRLDDGDVIGSSVYAIPRQFETAQETLDSTIGAALAECALTPPRDGTVVEEILALPEGTYGHRSTSTAGTATGVFEKVFAPHDDHVVTVSINHRGTGDPSADIRDLLTKALERADELD